MLPIQFGSTRVFSFATEIKVEQNDQHISGKGVENKKDSFELAEGTRVWNDEMGKRVFMATNHGDAEWAKDLGDLFQLARLLDAEQERLNLPQKDSEDSFVTRVNEEMEKISTKL